MAFRRIFGNENKKEILISFLNSLLELPSDRLIENVEILPCSQVPKLEISKESILDVKCTDQRGITYIVEMQICKYAAFAKRSQYYVAKAYSAQIEEGDHYPKLNQVIFLGILGFNMFQSPHYLTNHLILKKTTGEHSLKDLQFNFVELPKFNKQEAELESIEDKWIYFLKNARNLEMIPNKLKEEPIQEAFKILEKFSWSREELETYEALGIARADKLGQLEYAQEEGFRLGLERGLQKGVKEGLEQGLQQGIEQGKEEGLQQGRKEALKEALHKMLENGITEEQAKNILGFYD